MTKYPQVLLNIETKHCKKLVKQKKIQQAISDAELELKGKGRVLLRSSGTEPVVRVMVEGSDTNLINSTAKQLAAVVSEVAAQII